MITSVKAKRLFLWSQIPMFLCVKKNFFIVSEKACLHPLLSVPSVKSLCHLPLQSHPAYISLYLLYGFKSAALRHKLFYYWDSSFVGKTKAQGLTIKKLRLCSAWQILGYCWLKIVKCCNSSFVESEGVDRIVEAKAK